jgi:hypothetical protein
MISISFRGWRNPALAERMARNATKKRTVGSLQKQMTYGNKKYLCKTKRGAAGGGEIKFSAEEGRQKMTLTVFFLTFKIHFIFHSHNIPQDKQGDGIPIYRLLQIPYRNYYTLPVGIPIALTPRKIYDGARKYATTQRTRKYAEIYSNTKVKKIR